MQTLTGTFNTENGGKYLQQLCKHFGHKVAAQWSEDRGTVSFEFGETVFEATKSALTVSIDLKDTKATDLAKGVIDRHLERFAFREDFKNMAWS